MADRLWQMRGGGAGGHARVVVRLLGRRPSRHDAVDGISGADEDDGGSMTRRIRILIAAVVLCPLLVWWLTASSSMAQPSDGYEVNDSHLHLTNYIQEGTGIHDLLKVMGTRVGRVALFGIPLQQQWAYSNTGDFAPTYYLQTDAPLYYYSFTDAHIAMAYRSLTAAERARFDPMITGFNPADMYAADHIRRVLTTFPGVFSGIGEFTIHKEFVSSKIAGETASLLNPALDRILDFAAEVGLVAILHNDIDMPFPKPGQEPYQVAQLNSLLSRHPRTTVIWAHAGLGRVVAPLQDRISTGYENPVGLSQIEILDRALSNPRLAHLNIDLSWDETAKYILATSESLTATAELINRHSDRFLFGTDEVAPTEQVKYLKVYAMYAPLFARLTPGESERLRKKNYERLFDAARRRVRAWEQANVKETQ
jgi:Amidohydrolase